MTNYKKIIGLSLVIILTMASISAYGQSRDFVIQRMNYGGYSTAVTILEGMCNAYPENNDYANLLTAAKRCRTLQNDGLKFARQKQYSNAIAKYQAILQIHPGDKNAAKQIEVWRNAEMNHKLSKNNTSTYIQQPQKLEMNDYARSLENDINKQLKSLEAAKQYNSGLDYNMKQKVSDKLKELSKYNSNKYKGYKEQYDKL